MRKKGQPALACGNAKTGSIDGKEGNKGMGKHMYINTLTFFLLSTRLVKEGLYISSSSFFLLSTLSRNAPVRVYAWGGWERGKKRKKVNREGWASLRKTVDGMPIGEAAGMNAPVENREVL